MRAEDDDGMVGIRFGRRSACTGGRNRTGSGVVAGGGRGCKAMDVGVRWDVPCMDVAGGGRGKGAKNDGSKIIWRGRVDVRGSFE